MIVVGTLNVGCISLTIQGKCDLKALSSEKIMINTQPKTFGKLSARKYKTYRNGSVLQPVSAPIKCYIWNGV